MAFLSLVVGVFIGGLAVIFAFQNTAEITVTLFSWTLTGSLAIVLFCTLLVGVLAAFLILLPSLIRDELYITTIRKQKKDLEEELKKQKTISPAPAAHA